MTSRTTVASLVSLFALSIVAAASCGGGSGSSSSAPPPPKTTTSTSGLPTTAGGGDMGTTGSGGTGGSGMGGAGGAGGGTGGASSCTDMMLNGKETDKDCGGPTCAPCPANQGCKVSADCVSKNCDTSIHKCAIETCMDGVINGKETDTDCGGGFCPGCGVAKSCEVATDCKGATCTNKACAPTCTDGSFSPDLNETDVDCGGNTCPKCDTGLACNVAGDCKNKVCNAGTGKCDPPKCTDKLQNGNESDIDCGGPFCTACSAGQKCVSGPDCLSTLCTGNICACPAGMKSVPRANGPNYCIDAYEVTNAQYINFIAANPQNIQNLPAVCASNIFTPGGAWPPMATAYAYPVAYIDWCDAFSYCAYYGKHLCGKIGGGANPDPLSSPLVYANAIQSEWYNACTAQAVNEYPYDAHNYDHAACRGADQVTPGAPGGSCGVVGSCLGRTPVDGGANASCQGGVVGVYGMSGNAAEWENSCDDTVNPTVCHIRGGSHCDSGADNISLRCDQLATRSVLDNQACDVGFRCCF
ncbi:MAG: SUMF1/EgtB/PvdO family nonheme iron enzyme [Byssovorax sp.]